MSERRTRDRVVCGRYRLAATFTQAEIYLKHLRNARTTLHQGSARPVGAGSR